MSFDTLRSAQRGVSHNIYLLILLYSDTLIRCRSGDRAFCFPKAELVPPVPFRILY